MSSSVTPEHGQGRRRRRVLAPAMAIVVLVGACRSGEDQSTAPSTTADAPPTTATPVAGEATLTDRQCPPADRPADCYTLEVPEVHGQEGGATLALPVVVHHPRDGAAPDDPILVPDGGPGVSNFHSALPDGQGFADATGRDTIYWAQRGTPDASPSLACPHLETTIYLGNFQRADPYEQERDRYGAGLDQCRARLVADGVDLDAYDTVQNALDAVALRRALGVEQWNLFGLSYGSRLSLELLRVDPAAVRSVVLDSVCPPGSGGPSFVVDATARGIDALVAGCESDEACASRYPDLGSTLERTIAQWDADPVEVAVPFDDGTTETFVFDGGDLYAGILSAFSDPDLLRRIPQVVTQFADGDLAAVPALAQGPLTPENGPAEGMSRSVNCADNAAIEDPAAAEVLADPGVARNVVLYASTSGLFCDRWDVAPIGAGFADPVTTAAPALVLAGTYDQTTPPAGSEAVAEDLGATFVTVEGVGHGVQGTSTCIDDMITAFFDDPTAPVDTACAEAITGPDFA